MKALDVRLTMGRTVSPYQTWRFAGDLSHDERAAFAACAAEAGARAQMISNARFGETYVLLDVPDGAALSKLATAYPQAERSIPAIIALGIEPEAADALPALAQALGGSGAPAGVRRAEVRKAMLLLEFDPAQTAWLLMKTLIDTELLRFGSTTRRTSLLSPLTLEMETQIAADGLECPDMKTNRVLETFVSDVDH